MCRVNPEGVHLRASLLFLAKPPQLSSRPHSPQQLRLARKRPKRSDDRLALRGSMGIPKKIGGVSGGRDALALTPLTPPIFFGIPIDPRNASLSSLLFGRLRARRS